MWFVTTRINCYHLACLVVGNYNDPTRTTYVIHTTSTVVTTRINCYHLACLVVGNYNDPTRTTYVIHTTSTVVSQQPLPLHPHTHTHTLSLRSYSWSANVCGCKEWLLFPPGEEELLKDKFGYLPFDVTSRELENKELYPNAHKSCGPIRVMQRSGEIIFVPR